MLPLAVVALLALSAAKIATADINPGGGSTVYTDQVWTASEDINLLTSTVAVTFSFCQWTGSGTVRIFGPGVPFHTRLKFQDIYSDKGIYMYSLNLQHPGEIIYENATIRRLGAEAVFMDNCLFGPGTKLLYYNSNIKATGGDRQGIEFEDSTFQNMQFEIVNTTIDSASNEAVTLQRMTVLNSELLVHQSTLLSGTAGGSETGIRFEGGGTFRDVLFTVSYSHIEATNEGIDIDADFYDSNIMIIGNYIQGDDDALAIRRQVSNTNITFADNYLARGNPPGGRLIGVPGGGIGTGTVTIRNITDSYTGTNITTCCGVPVTLVPLGECDIGLDCAGPDTTEGVMGLAPDCQCDCKDLYLNGHYMDDKCHWHLKRDSPTISYSRTHPTVTFSRSLSFTITPAPTRSPTFSETHSGTRTITPAPTRTQTYSSTLSQTASRSLSDSVSPTGTSGSRSLSLSVTATITPAPTPTATFSMSTLR